MKIRFRTIGERLVAKWRELGLTRKHLARYLGWDEATVYRYEAGEWNLRGERIARIEEFLTLHPAGWAIRSTYPVAVTRPAGLGRLDDLMSKAADVGLASHPMVSITAQQS